MVTPLEEARLAVCHARQHVTCAKTADDQQVRPCDPQRLICVVTWSTCCVNHSLTSLKINELLVQ